MKIRSATADDASLIARFNAELARETEARLLDSARLLAGVQALLADPGKGRYWLAELDGVIAGQLMVTPEWSDWRNGYFWWIQSVYVREEFRRRGIFTALFNHVRQLATDEKACGLRLYVEGGNEQARRTYGRLGMKQTSYEVFEIDFVA